MARGTFSGTQRFGVSLPLSGLADMAVHCWALLNGSQSANNRIWQLGDGSHGVGLGFQVAGTTVQVVDEIVAWRGSGTAVGTGVWIPFGLARAGSGVWQVYVNGVNTENPGAAPNALAGQMTLGNDISATHSFNGYLGPVSVWSNALTAAQFALLAKGVSPLLIQNSQLQMHIPMYGASGAASHEPDYSSHQRGGNQVGSPGVPNIHPPTVSPFPQ